MQSEAGLAQAERALGLDPTLASAYAELSFLAYAQGDVFTALTMARNAYDADAYLSNSDLILSRLFWTSYDTEQFGEATKWCDEGRRRFPKDGRFSACQLWMMLTPDAKPDIDQAWRLAARTDSLYPPDDKPLFSHLDTIIVGGVIGRASKAAPAGPVKKSLRDSAERVLVSARPDLKTDPERELVGYEALMRTLMGDLETAVTMLKQYVAINPDHSFEVGGNIHWWWRDLRSNPGFQAVMKRKG